MARRPTFSKRTREQLSKLSRNDMKAISRLPTLETDDPAFGKIFVKDPGAALAAKGLELDPKEVANIQKQISELSRVRVAGMDKVETEVSVGIKVKW